ncbi:zeta toxin family protein, partial [Aggregatibacter actinomycetemcomitans]
HAHKKTGNFSHRFARGLLDISIKKRVNVIYESTFGNIETARSLIEPFKNAGYTVLVIQLPVDMRLSIERNLRRYEEKKEDMHTLPRMVAKDDIERMANNYLQNLNTLKEEGINIYTFDGKEDIHRFVEKSIRTAQFRQRNQAIKPSPDSGVNEKITPTFKLKI